MTDKITPQQAYEAVKVLWPEAVFIRRGDGASYWIDVHYSQGINRLIAASFVDWPEGVHRWPMPEPKWRDATFPGDYGKPARFRDAVDETWIESKLCGFNMTYSLYYSESNSMWRYCQVRDDLPFGVVIE